jgi:RHS repeat-associated protein
MGIASAKETARDANEHGDKEMNSGNTWVRNHGVRGVKETDVVEAALAGMEACDPTDIVRATVVSDAFGNITSESGAIGRCRWTGRARYHLAEIARWLGEDPLGFEAGDANLYRYVGNQVTLAVDANGLKFQPVKANKLVLQVQVQFKFNGEWTKMRMDRFRRQYTQEVEKIWNEHPFQLVSANPKCKPIKPEIKIDSVNAIADPAHGYVVDVKAGDGGGVKAHTFILRKLSFVTESDAAVVNYQFASSKGSKGKTSQNTLAHEFGHLLGLRHPGAKIPNDYDDPLRTGTIKEEPGTNPNDNRPAAYDYDPYALMGLGNEMRGSYFVQWREHLNKIQPSNAPWKVKADLTHKMYKELHEHWKTWTIDRFGPVKWGLITDFPKTDHPLRFED